MDSTFTETVPSLEIQDSTQSQPVVNKPADNVSQLNNKITAPIQKNKFQLGKLDERIYTED